MKKIKIFFFEFENPNFICFLNAPEKALNHEKNGPKKSLGKKVMVLMVILARPPSPPPCNTIIYIFDSI
jgi:hypothetical protein